ncbi:TPR repeat-containing protein [Mycolicibacterium canariasense]|uniref:TPR repeat-containing protein n=1 Tax=Mycolicibacterium canariasense TaxID=228230 RepID=A0A124E1M2_MYCCR|nr:tetratricopeptide repeat protein [Mycolicibacterium canariasense]MCV7213056.1 tetratricopeptide repeat protein [Mycolicibacterium canariasense]ORU95174.1 hypothetical protein AWB94_32295 [Mycolicibacterium canariasense]GAS94128.1 TPR repeat-containing protein [Mycolicibacterium canariasense]
MSTAAGAGDAAIAYLDAGDYQRAVEVLQAALTRDPGNGLLLARYAQARLGLRDYGGAASAAHAGLGVMPGNAYLERVYALALYGLGRRQEALQLAWRATTEHPDDPLALSVYARLLHQAGFDREAFPVINEALRLNPASADALVLRGDIALRTVNRSAAEADYHHALRLEPGHAAAMHNLAVTRLRWGSLTKALSGFLGAGRLDPRLGPAVRDSIGAVLIRVLRPATASVVFLATALIFVGNVQELHHSTLVPRVFAAVLSLVLGGVLIWVVCNVPGPTLVAVLRERLVLALRLLFLVVAAGIGVIIAVVGAPSSAAVLGPVLLLGMIGLTVLGWVVGQ